jgi:hypothetical protein
MRFELQLIESISKIYELEQDHSLKFNVDNYYKNIEDILNYKPYIKNFAKIKEDNTSKPMTPQFADNCITKSMLGALGYLYPEKYEFYSKVWTNSLEKEMVTIVPKLTKNDFNNMLKKQDTLAEEDWLFLRGKTLFAHAKNLNVSDKDRIKLYTQSFHYYDKFLNLGKNNKSKYQSEAFYPNLTKRIQIDLNEIKENLQKLQ